MLARPDTTCCSSNVSMFVLCLGPLGVCWWWILQRISVSFPLPPFLSLPPSLLVSLPCCFSVCKWLLLLQLYSRTQNTSFHLQNINIPSPGPICLLNLTALSTSWDFRFIVWHETDWIILLPTYHHSHKDPVSPVVSLSSLSFRGLSPSCPLYKAATGQSWPVHKHHKCGAGDSELNVSQKEPMPASGRMTCETGGACWAMMDSHHFFNPSLHQELVNNNQNCITWF